MKLRIKGNMIRFRLSKTDVESFAITGIVEEFADFGEGRPFEYSVRSSEQVTKLTAKLQDKAIILFVPVEAGKIWAEGSEVGLQEIQDVGKGKTLHLLLE